MAISPLSASPRAAAPQGPANDALAVRDAFVSFFGETFYGQMIKAMRSSVDKPAYFHGGRAEEIFTSQLDQTFSEQMTEASADQLAGPMFENQFPELARILREAKQEAKQDKTSGPIRSLADLDGLRRN